jgi:Ca-activated chloride channel family protein
MTFATPWAFLLLLILPLIIYRYKSRSGFGLRSGRLLFPSTTQAAEAGTSLRTRLIHLPFFLRLALLVLLVVSLARPQEGTEKIFDISRGVAMEVVLDRSSSMKAEMIYNGQQVSRLEAAKQVFLAFVRGNGKDLGGRPNDLIGLVTFGRYADTACPLTLAHDALASFVDPIELVSRKSEDGTAIGDAVALAAARLQKAEETMRQQTREEGDNADSYEIKSKIIILLTDGEQNAGSRTPQEAAELANKWGIKIYTIGIGGRESLVRVPTLFGTGVVRRGSGVDTKTLPALAEATGGIFRMAEDGETLLEVYREIDELEKSEVQSVRYTEYRERFMLFALLALALLGLEIVLRTTWLRRVP